jgi:hypothetical protein
VKAAPEGVAMFIRPDWCDLEPYKKLLKPEATYRRAWEFLRRNPEYQKDFDEYAVDCPSDKASGDTPMHFWFNYFRFTWKIWIPMPPNGDEFTPEQFLYTYCLGVGDHEVVRPGDRSNGPLVLMPFDLSAPLESLEAQFAFEVRRLRDEGREYGTFIPRTSKVLSPRRYVEQLRILDATAAGATVREIGDVLEPNAANTPDERQRDKRIKAAHTAALKMQGGGYRALI